MSTNYPNYKGPNYYQHYSPYPQKTSSLPTWSLVLGLLSFLFGALTGIPAIITGILGLKKDPKNLGFSLTGIITGTITTIGSAIILVTVIQFIVSAGQMISSIADPFTKNNAIWPSITAVKEGTDLLVINIEDGGSVIGTSPHVYKTYVTATNDKQVRIAIGVTNDTDSANNHLHN